MKIIALAAAGATLAFGAWLSPAQTGGWRPPSAYATQSAGGKAITVRRASGGAACMLTASGGSHFLAGPGCAEVAAPLSGHIALEEGDGGTAWLSDQTGRILLEFSAGEGGLYESVRPSDPLLLLDTGA